MEGGLSVAGHHSTESSIVTPRLRTGLSYGTSSEQYQPPTMSSLTTHSTRSPYDEPADDADRAQHADHRQGNCSHEAARDP
jgi:hypothetical protein